MDLSSAPSRPSNVAKFYHLADGAKHPTFPGFHCLQGSARSADTPGLSSSEIASRERRGFESGTRNPHVVKTPAPYGMFSMITYSQGVESARARSPQ